LSQETSFWQWPERRIETGEGKRKRTGFSFTLP
jgi:hypothetical protein